MSLSQQAKEKYYDRIDIAQLVVSILVFFLSLVWMGFEGLAAFGQVAKGYGTSVAVEPGMGIGLMLTGLVFLVISFVSVVTTIKKITGHAKIIKPINDKVGIWSIAELLLVFGLAMLAGFAFPDMKAIALAILAVPGIAIPVFWLLRIGSRGQTEQNPKRKSGILTFSIGISIPFIVLVEVLVFIILMIVLSSGLFRKPEFMELFNAIRNNPELLQNDPASLFSDFGDMFDLKNLMGWLLLVVAGIIPLVEELFKTLGVWLLKVRNPDPAASFRAGLLCGGGFALFEGLLSVSSLGVNTIEFTEWAGLILGRFGGSLLHILTGGIIGLAIGKFWQNRKFSLLFLSYLSAWFLHAAWNTLAIFGGVNPLINESQMQAVWPYVGLVILFVGMLFIYLRLIRNVRTMNPLPVYPAQLEG
jgi:hypothetical protein